MPPRSPRVATRHARPDRGAARVHAAGRRHGRIPQLRRRRFLHRPTRYVRGLEFHPSSRASTTPTSASIPRPRRGAWMATIRRPATTALIPFRRGFPTATSSAGRRGRLRRWRRKAWRGGSIPAAIWSCSCTCCRAASRRRVRPSIGLYFSERSAGPHAGHAPARAAETSTSRPERRATWSPTRSCCRWTPKSTPCSHTRTTARTTSRPGPRCRTGAAGG